MILEFTGVVRSTNEAEQMLGVDSAAAIDAIHIHLDTLLHHRDGRRSSWGELQPGALLRVRGEDEGGRCLRAKEIVVVREAAQRAHSPSHAQTAGAWSRTFMALLSDKSFGRSSEQSILRQSA